MLQPLLDSSGEEAFAIFEQRLPALVEATSPALPTVQAILVLMDGAVATAFSKAVPATDEGNAYCHKVVGEFEARGIDIELDEDLLHEEGEDDATRDAVRRHIASGIHDRVRGRYAEIVSGYGEDGLSIVARRLAEHLIHTAGTIRPHSGRTNELAVSIMAAVHQGDVEATMSSVAEAERWLADGLPNKIHKSERGPDFRSSGLGREVRFALDAPARAEFLRIAEPASSDEAGGPRF